MEGIYNRMYRTNRQDLCRKLLLFCMHSFVMMIKAPPMSGKTALMQLAVTQREWLQSQFPEKDIEIGYVNMLKVPPGADLDQALKCTFPDPEDMFHGWERVCQTPPPMAGGKL